MGFVPQPIGASVAGSMIVGAARTVDLVIEDVLATLVVEVVESRRDHAALLRDVGTGEDFGDVHVHEKTGLVVDHRRSGLRIGKRRAGGEEGGETED